MTLEKAAQLALDVQDASNASGVIKSLERDILPVIWDVARNLERGTKLVNRNPLTAMFLYKLGELNGRDISSLNDGYAEAEKACTLLASGLNYQAVVDLETGRLLEHMR